MTPEQIAKAKADKEAAEAKESVKKEENDLDKELELFDNHQKFATLHFLTWNGSKYDKKALKDSALEFYEKLEKMLKKLDGKMPKKSATVSLGIGINMKIVEGIPTPNSIYKKFVEAEAEDKYF